MSTLQERYVVDAQGSRMAVILSLDQYERLMEDLHDLASWLNTERKSPSALKR